jgi:hypothetical protein
MMALHLRAFAGSGPAVELLLQFFVGGYWLLWHRVALPDVQRRIRLLVSDAATSSMLQFFSSWQHVPKMISLNLTVQRYIARTAPKR